MVALAILAALTGLAGCDQDKVLYNGRNYLMFSDTLYHYAVQESNEKLEVPVSATRRADYDRTFAVEVVDKESNAVEGKHYRLLSNTVTIKAGEVAANVEIEGVYENIGINDSLGFALRLIIPDVEQWHKYGTETKVVMQKACPFDIHAFTGYCKVTSTFFNTYMENTTLRLITSEIVEGEENTIVLHGLYFDGYDTKLKFNNEDILDPSIEMEEHVCGNTAELFNTIHGNGKLVMDLRQITTFIALAPIRHRSQIRRIGFEHQTMQRNRRLQGCRQIGFLESHDSVYTQGKILERKQLFGFFDGTDKAMEDAP